MFMPAVVTFILQKFVYKEPIMRTYEVKFRPNKWFFVAWLFPPLFAFVVLGVSILFPGVEFSLGMEGLFERLAVYNTPEQIVAMQESAKTLPLHPFWLSLISGLIAGVSVNAIFGFGEELGWRGLLQKEFSDMGFWKGSLLIGLIWGIWHVPLILQGFNYPQHPILGIFLMLAWAMLMAPTFAFVRLKAKSVVAAAILHGSLNGSIGLSMMMLKGGSDLLVGGMGLAGLIVLVFINFLIYKFKP